jgi:hypothetical protein
MQISVATQLFNGPIIVAMKGNAGAEGLIIHSTYGEPAISCHRSPRAPGGENIIGTDRPRFESFHDERYKSVQTK